MSSNTALIAAKKAFRNLVKKSLKTLTPEAISQQSNVCVKTILSLPEYQVSTRIGVYLSMPEKEVQTRAIIEDAFKNGKTVYVPYLHKTSHPIPSDHASEGVTDIISTTSTNNPVSSHPVDPTRVPLPPAPPNSIMDMLSLHSLQDYQSLKPDSWGIPSIPPQSLAERENCLEKGLDLLIMPGVAFGLDFRRLGHGKGYYDYFLSRYKDTACAQPEIKMPALVATGLSPQIHPVNTIPVDASDWLVDVLVTGDGRCLRRET